MNGRPRCKRQPPTSKPSIPSSGVRSSTGLPGNGRAAPARHCWSGIRKDQYPRPSGRPSDRSGCRPPPDPVDDVFPSRRVRDDQTCRADRAQGDGRQRRDHDGRPDLGRHLPWHRRPAIARVRRTDADRSSRKRSSPTRFIPEKLLGLFERTAWPLSVRTAARAAGQISVLHAGSSDRRSDICGGAPRT